MTVRDLWNRDDCHVSGLLLSSCLSIEHLFIWNIPSLQI